MTGDRERPGSPPPLEPRRRAWLGPWMLLVVVGIVALAAHAAVGSSLLSAAALPVVVVGGVVAVVVLGHLGLLRSLHRLVRRWPRRSRRS